LADSATSNPPFSSADYVLGTGGHSGELAVRLHVRQRALIGRRLSNGAFAIRFERTGV